MTQQRHDIHFCQHRVCLVKVCRMNYNLKLKDHSKGNCSPSRHMMLSEITPSSWRIRRFHGHLWCFHPSRWSLLKVIAEKLLVTFHDMKCSWRHDEETIVAIFQLKVLSLSVNRYLGVGVSNGFRPKEAPFIFLPWTYNRGRKMDLALGHRYQNSEISIS